MSTPLPADLREALGTPQFTEAVLDEACAVLDDVRTAVLQWAAARYRALPVAWQDRPPEKSPLRHLEEAEAAEVEARCAADGAAAAAAYYDAAGRAALEDAGVPAGAMYRMCVLHTCREAEQRMGTHGVDSGAWRAHIRHLEGRQTLEERDWEGYQAYMDRMWGR